MWCIFLRPVCNWICWLANMTFNLYEIAQNHFVLAETNLYEFFIISDLRRMDNYYEYYNWLCNFFHKNSYSHELQAQGRFHLVFLTLTANNPVASVDEIRFVLPRLGTHAVRLSVCFPWLQQKHTFTLSFMLCGTWVWQKGHPAGRWACLEQMID